MCDHHYKEDELSEGEKRLSSLTQVEDLLEVLNQHGELEDIDDDHAFKLCVGLPREEVSEDNYQVNEEVPLHIVPSDLPPVCDDETFGEIR